MLGTWVKRSLRHYGVRHAVFAGTVALASAVLCAALLTGESLEAGLRRGLRERLGPIRSAVSLSEGTFPAALAGRLPSTRAALLLRGELLDASGSVCASGAQVIGVDVTNACLNARGRELLDGSTEGAVRFEKPRAYSVEMPLGAAKEARLVRRAVQWAAGGRQWAVGSGQSKNGPLPPEDFALQAASVPPVNVWMPQAALSEAAGVPDRANLLVSDAPPEAFGRALATALTPEDAGLALETGGQAAVGNRPLAVGNAPSNIASRGSQVAHPETIVKSARVFLPPGLVSALEAKGLKTASATFHLADAFEKETNATPYGFVAAMEPGTEPVPGDLKDDEVVVNAWLAGTLGVTTNDTLVLRWRRFEAGGRLVSDSRVFRVRAVLPMERADGAKKWMPTFPGLKDVDSCADWDVGLPMDKEKLKDAANEAYWKQWRETPKAFLTYAAGRACFGSAFGEAMSVRVSADGQTVRAALRALPPDALGFAVRPVWKEGVAVAAGATDFKSLFVGMAFVLMAAALLLASLSLSLSLETRTGEVALLGAVGWPRALIVRVLMAEWGLPLLVGAAMGAFGGVGLARALVWGLDRFWRGAFAGAAVGFALSWPLAVAAAGVSAALASVVLARTAWRFAGCPPTELWRTAGNWRVDGGRGRGAWWENVAGAALAMTAAAVMMLSPSGAAADGVFFGAGFLLMVSMLLFLETAGTVWRGRRPEVGSRKSEDGDERGIIASPVAAGVCRAVLSPRRSAPVVILLAVGAFLAIGILSMKHDPAEGCDKPWSGGGGFASIVTSVTPLERERGLALARRASGAKGVVPVRVYEGDEAGCLNMNRPVRPRVLGVEARAMARARAFEPEDAGGVWSQIEQALPDGAVPALAADQAMLQYSLKARTGATDGAVYEYPTASGRTVHVRVVGVLPVRSGILEGALIVDERAFVDAFGDAGYQMWLCDYAPYLLREAAEKRGQGSGVGIQGSEGGESPVTDHRSPISALRHPEPGVTVETVEERLRLLGTVESTYLDMFLVLGGLGVVLGVFGVALVVLRGVAERRGELALLSAVGLPRAGVVRLLAAEYGTLVFAGIFAGVVPALAAIQPAARSLGGRMPWGAMAAIIGGVVVCALASVLLAALAASHRYGPEVLKEEE